jgi:hypothetical protein
MVVWSPEVHATNSIETVDCGFVGRHTSLALEPSGNPVVSYYDELHENLKLVHCNDPNCAAATAAPAPTPRSAVQ